jgi:hypothetical protein
LSVGSIASFLPPTANRKLAMVASNWRFHAADAVIDFSWNNCSTRSSS